MLKKIYKHRCFIFSFLLFFCLILGLSGYTSVQAAGITKDNYQDTYPDDVDSDNEKNAYDNYKSIITGEATKDCMPVLTGEKFTELGLDGTMETVYGAVKNIGIALLVVFFLTELLDKSTKQDYNLEILLRMLIKYFIMKAIMDNGYFILQALLNISNALVGSINAASIGDQQITLLNQIGQAIADMDWISCVLMNLTGFIVSLIYKILGLIILAACYGRLFDITIRGGLAPIGCASMVQDGFTGHGLRYIKKYFSSCLEAVVIAAILFIGTKMSATTLSQLTASGSGMAIAGSAISSLLIPATELMLILKAGSIANDVSGL